MDRGVWRATVHGIAESNTNTFTFTSILNVLFTGLPWSIYPIDKVFLFLFYFTILYWFCHTSTWIRHGSTRVPNPEPPSHLPSHTIPLGHPSAPVPSILYPASNLDWWFISYMILYMFQCPSPKSSHPLPLIKLLKQCFLNLNMHSNYLNHMVGISFIF